MSQLPSPVKRTIAAANHGDTDAFLATFTADGVVDDWGREFVGREAIRGWSDREFIGVQVALTVTTVSSANGAISVHADVGGNGFNGPSTFTFLVAGDAVARMTIRG
jgi:hypothetical protein